MAQTTKERATRRQIADHDVVAPPCPEPPVGVVSHGRQYGRRVPETLIVERADGVVSVTMNRPERKNAANDVMWNELLATFREVAASPTDRVMVLTGAGDAFCSGADVGGMKERTRRRRRPAAAQPRPDASHR